MWVARGSSASLTRPASTSSAPPSGSRLRRLPRLPGGRASLPFFPRLSRQEPPCRRTPPQPGPRVTEGAHCRITAGGGPLAVHEPVRVVAVVETPGTRGFAYGTLPGHPESGKEAFIVRRHPDGQITLTPRSLTAPAPEGPWRLAFPLLLPAQRFYRRRYPPALRGAAAR
ncbi:DUF1990 family protein [Streptomyces sp. NPDC007084]|uniref:DUF1990 family protein n=1 Tax=Streptomyces sp. NPDC007084 TaxID=3154313 RepID=UPI003455D1EA